MSNDLTMTGATYGTGEFGQGLTSGSGSTSAYPIGSVFTLEIWFRTTSTAGNQVMFSINGSYIGLDGSGKFINGFGMGSGTASYNDGVFHHMEVDSTASGITAYVDGVSIATGSAITVASGSTLTIGTHQGFGFGWVGGLDEFASWSITRHTANFTPPTSAYASGLANMYQLYHFNGNGTDSVAALALPGVPTIGTVTAGNAQVTVPFTPASTGGAAANFTATWTPSTGTPVTATGTGSPIVIAGLTNGVAGTAHVVANNATGSSAASAESNTVTPTASATPNVISITDSKVLWSNWNWDNPTGAYKVSQYAGAFAKLTVNGTSIAIGVDVSAMSSFAAGSYPIIRTVIDDVSFVDTQLTSGMTSVTRTFSSGTHNVDVYVLAFDENAGDFWTTPVNAVRITGFTLDSGSVATQYTGRPNSMRYDGDSISRGFMALGTTTTMPAGNSALHGIPFSVAKAFNAELGLVAFTGQGYEQVGNGNVPVWSSTWDKYSSGRSRLTSGLLVPQPTHWFQEMGTNGTTTQADVQTMLTNMRGAAPNAIIGVVVPANGFGRAALTAGVAAQGDAKAYLIDIGTNYASGISQFGSGPNMWSIDGLHRNILCNSRVGAAVTRTAQAVIGGSTPTPPLTPRSVSIQFNMGDTASPVPAANLTGFSVSMYDESTAATTTVARFQSATETTDGTGTLQFTFGSTLASGQSGFLTVNGPNGIHYNGPWVVS